MHLSNNTSLQGGKYKIIRFLSSGGFGNTYEGVHTMMDTRVAIKEFFPKMFCNRDENTSHVTVATQGNRELVDKLRKKFNEEAKSIFKMKHDNIVRVLDIFEENGTAYYVMEYINGKSLNEITKERGALPESEAVGYIRQVADALKYVHSLNRLHLDIKPGNIMVDKNGKAILIDFGASKHYDDESGENTSTLMDVNTKGYAPIEQSTQSFTSFSPATDIYALGATLYKLLTGVTPPDANLLLAEEATLEPLPNNISIQTSNAVMTAMQLRRKNRPQCIDEFVEILEDKHSVDKKPRDHKQPQKILDNEKTYIDTENQFAKDVKELCELTGISLSGCEKALKQTNGNKRAALIKIQTNNLYKKHGCTELGIGRGTCKKHLEEANCSYEKAEGQLIALKTIRTSDLDEIIRYGSLVANLDAETCKKIYMQVNCNKEQAIQFISANINSFTERTEKNTNSNKIKKWVILLLFAVIGYGGYLIYEYSLNQEYVTDRVYKDANGQNYTYTGYISQNGPDGKGTGVYSYGTYTGEYKNGLRHGNGEFKSTDGSNKYKGTFSNDKYDTGILTVADGYYFDGNFKDGQPYSGSWYDKTGRFDSKVVNGK